MGRERPSYNAVPYFVPQYVDYLTDTGETTQYEVFLDAELNKRLVKCDRCALLIPLTTKDNPIQLRTHRESDQCDLEIRRTAKGISKQNNRVIDELASTVEGIPYTIHFVLQKI